MTNTPPDASQENEINGLELFPLGTTLFPDGVLMLNIFEPRYLSMIKRHYLRSEPFGVVTLLDGFEVKLPGKNIEIANVGTLAKIVEFDEIQPAMFMIRCVGWRRFKIIDRLAAQAGVERANVSLLPEDPKQGLSEALQGCANMLGQFIAQNQARGVKLSQFPFTQPFCLDESGWVANRWAELLVLDPRERVDLLSECDPNLRLSRIKELMDL